mmetsp:Transcript_21756/g.55522  ORF Transcript_21756/g.55522 Transcript_21756/m.55522 type:complete len:102 (+) Transcript_21756:47-352(+)|eukprot:CAMPEP_0115849720 /NCGR_PEP_ID=MMETSP0287-20121206/11596_1 /TAXON_ID=412157 /ORGANISM="Chrysochromulina rotalis, Strain UIO044" /LENGTH=101 /DNA_ID=CAMNT_0003303699 /DNA_START=40 /DNA_END=345 /DNA_ORIENTATION=-
MPPVKMRNMPEERRQNFIALKQEVAIPDLIAKLMDSADERQAAGLQRTLEMYNKGSLRGPAAFTLCKTTIGLPVIKAAFEDIVPGYKHDHSAFSYEHPIVV